VLERAHALATQKNPDSGMFRWRDGTEIVDIPGDADDLHHEGYNLADYDADDDTFECGASDDDASNALVPPPATGVDAIDYGNKDDDVDDESYIPDENDNDDNDDDGGNTDNDNANHVEPPAAIAGTNACQG
jgi:hypothetical protein